MMTTTRAHFDHELAKLLNDMAHLNEMVKQAIAASIAALNDHDLALARQIDQEDANINKLRFDIESQAYTLVALQQPNATDMRLLMASVSIVTNLERMGDHAAGIARLVERIGADHSIAVPAQFKEMSAELQKMADEAFAALDARDAKALRHVVVEDEKIDTLHKQVYDHLIKQMVADDSKIEACTFMLWISHSLERIGDCLTNICERILYLITGELTEHLDPMP